MALSGQQRFDIITADVPAASVRMIAQTLAIPHETVANTFRKYEPVAEAFRTLKASWLTGMWQSTLVGVLAKLHDGAHGIGEKLTSVDAKNWAITAGIATEKLLLLTGQPTQITANLHEVRVDVTELVSRFQRAMKGRQVRVIEPPAEG